MPKTIFILISYVEEYVKGNEVCLWLVSRPPNSGSFFGKFTLELVWKSFSGKSSSLEPPVFFLIFDSLSYGLEESREF